MFEKHSYLKNIKNIIFIIFIKPPILVQYLFKLAKTSFINMQRKILRFAIYHIKIILSTFSKHSTKCVKSTLKHFPILFKKYKERNTQGVPYMLYEAIWERFGV